MSRHIDFNCDLGEGCSNDAAIMPMISSANIACGAHAGDDVSIRTTLLLCAKHGVAAGAHPGYADRAGFGRREQALAAGEIKSLLGGQLQRISDLAAEVGVRLVHVKPHGALYNQAARDPLLADIIASVVHAFDSRLILVGLAASELSRAGIRHGLQVAHEAFADRRYLANGTLAPRDRTDAMIADINSAIEQALAIACGRPIETLDGHALQIHADTLCLHGDSPDAAQLASRLRCAFAAAGVELQSLGVD